MLNRADVVLVHNHQVVAAALRIGVAPSRVLQSSYEPIQFDETGALCGAQPTLGLDVHPNLKLSKARLQETADFLRDFLGRLECLASTAKGKSRLLVVELLKPVTV